jgi:hypothetical protein
LEKLNSLYSNKKYIKYLNNKNQDLDDIITLLRKLTVNASVVKGSLPVFKPEEFPLLRGMLLKWNQIYSKDMKASGQKLEIIDNSDNSLIRTDKSCLDQIVYNLINNAHKYAHYGSTIYVQYNRIEGNPYGELTVTDYGMEITMDQEKPYLLFYSGDNTREYGEGSGIGLFVSQQIATGLLRTKISHACKKISKYYVPFMQPYLEIDSPDEPIEKKNRIREELQRLKRNGLYRKIISDMAGLFDMPFPDEQINDMIDEPTYEVSFNIENL